MKYLLWVMSVAAVVLTGRCETAVARPQAASLNWQQTGTSLALHNGTNVVWKLVYDPQQQKTYFHPLATVDGQVLTAFRPADHPWHRGLWWSWKYINGLCYWEEDKKTGKSQGENELMCAKVTPNADFSATAELTFSYHPPKQPSLMTETRTLVVSCPASSGNYRIDWTSVFTVADQPVKLERTPPSKKGGVAWGGYTGLSLRFPHGVKGWSFRTSGNAGNAAEDSGKSAQWADFSSTTAGITVFDHPGNLRSPSPWYLNKDLPYFSPALLFNDPLELAPKQVLTLKYRVLVHSQAVTPEQLGAERKAFVERPLRVLILTGANNHNWKATTPVMKQALVECGRFEVDVTEHPEQCTAETFSKYDAVVSNWNSFGAKGGASDWPAATRVAFLDFVRNGKGAVFVHAGSSSFYDWPEYQQLASATWKNGQTSHHAPHAFTVKPSGVDHPVTRGMQPFTHKDELWLKPEVQTNAVVLATAEDQPVALATSFGKGRGFTTLMGHDATFMADPAFEKLLVRGVEWAATGK